MKRVVVSRSSSALAAALAQLSRSVATLNEPLSNGTETGPDPIATMLEQFLRPRGGDTVALTPMHDETSRMWDASRKRERRAARNLAARK